MKRALKPPQFQANVALNRVFRFKSTSATAVQITQRTALQACGVMAGTAILGLPIAMAVRLRSIEVWAPTTAVGAEVDTSILWNSATQNYGAQLEFSDSTNNISAPAHVKCSPPRKSLAEDFFIDGTTVLCNMIAPVGSIVEVRVQFVLVDGAAAIPATLVLVGATVGQIYYEPFDGRGGTLTPIGLTAN